MRSAFGFSSRKSEREEDDEVHVGLTAAAAAAANSPRRELKRPIVTTAKQSEMDQLEGLPPGAKEFIAALMQHRDRLIPRGMVQAMMFGPGPLGLFIVDVGPLVLVAAFESNSNNTPVGQAEILGQITPGDQVVSVNGRKCYGLGVNKVCRMMAVAKRPVRIEYRKMVISTTKTANPSQQSYSDDPTTTSTSRQIDSAHGNNNNNININNNNNNNINNNSNDNNNNATPDMDALSDTMRVLSHSTRSIEVFANDSNNPSVPESEEEYFVVQQAEQTNTAKLRNCDSCQTKLSRSNAKFCSNCGARLP